MSASFRPISRTKFGCCRGQEVGAQINNKYIRSARDRAFPGFSYGYKIPATIVGWVGYFDGQTAEIAGLKPKTKTKTSPIDVLSCVHYWSLRHIYGWVTYGEGEEGGMNVNVMVNVMVENGGG